MPRTLVLNLLASALTILAAVVLLGAAAFVGDGSQAAPNRTRHAVMVHRFYDAVNEALRTGHSATLDALLAPDLVVHASPPAAMSGRPALYERIRALRTIDPSLQLLVETIAASGDLALARVSVQGGDARELLGLPLALPPVAWGETDAFRIAGNRISELWTDAPAPAALDALQAVELITPLPGAQPLSLERLSAPVGDDWALGPYVEPRVLVVAAGAMSIVFAAGTPPVAHPLRRTAAGNAIDLAAGDMISIPFRSRYTFRADRAERGVTAFAVAAPRFSYDGPLQPHDVSTRHENAGPPRESGAELVVLARDRLPRMPERATVSFGRLTLPPGERIGFGETEGMVFLVAESGALVAGKERGAPAWGMLVPGSADLIAPGVATTLSNPGDSSASALLFTILPADDGRGTPS